MSIPHREKNSGGRRGLRGRMVMGAILTIILPWGKELAAAGKDLCTAIALMGDELKHGGEIIYLRR